MTALLARRLQPATTDHAFRTLVQEAEGDVRALVDALVTGDLPPAAWADQMLEALAAAHAEAAYRGRVRAGDHAPYERDDSRFGALVAQEEEPFLRRFQADIEAGRYGTTEPDEAAITRRALMYTARLYGTANEAWGLTHDEPIWWRLGEPETTHCTACPRLAAGSPYAPGQLPTVPGANATPCLSRCLCWLETAGGQKGFQP